MAVAIYGAKGLTLRTGAVLSSGGDPIHLNHLTRYQTVQEQPVIWGAAAGQSLMNLAGSPSLLPQARFQFTDLSLMAGNTSTRYILENNINPLAFTHCQIRGGFLNLFSGGGSQQTVALTNQYGV